MNNAGLSPDQTMAGILAMLAVMREDALAKGKDTDLRKTEVVLSDAGITNTQIAALLGKKPDTVHKTIARARNNATKNSKEVSNG